jgi:threonine synthase
MPSTNLSCIQCGQTVSPSEPVWSCPSCGSLLELRLQLTDLPAYEWSELVSAARGSFAASGIWRHAGLIPIDTVDPVTLGEGNTPVVQLKALGQRMGLPKLYAKLECLNPTGSFKDRGATTLVTKARELGVNRLVEDSSGNAGASLAAYCARAGIAASIYVPASAPASKKAQIAFYGAEVVAVEGSREAVTEAALDRCRRDGAYYASHNLNPFFLEGTKTFAYEVATEFENNPPEHVVVPVGNGSLLLGAWKGFRELRALGEVEKLPRMHAAQATGCMPIVDGYLRKLEMPEPITTSPTVAGGISIARPSRGHLILNTMAESGGGAAAATDEEILSCQRLLARTEGIFCEPTSAAALAVLPQLVAQGSIDPEDRVLVAITGMGLKDTSVLE